MKNQLVLLLLLTLVMRLSAQNPTYAPRDETYMDPSLNAFVVEMKKAIVDRNQRFFYSALDLDVEMGTSASDLLQDFKEEWETENDSSRFWPILDRMIQMGGVFLHDTADHTGRYQFVFPYVYDRPLDVEDDFYSIGVITGKKVNLRDQAKTSSPVRTQLSYDVVWYLQPDENRITQSGVNPYGDTEWYLVETYDHQQQGWVNWRYVYSPMDYRMFLFKNKQGIWRISNILAGD